MLVSYLECWETKLLGIYWKLALGQTFSSELPYEVNKTRHVCLLMLPLTKYIYLIHFLNIIVYRLGHCTCKLWYIKYEIELKWQYLAPGRIFWWSIFWLPFSFIKNTRKRKENDFALNISVNSWLWLHHIYYSQTSYRSKYRAFYILSNKFT